MCDNQDFDLGARLVWRSYDSQTPGQILSFRIARIQDESRSRLDSQAR
jgi:hypothetical protein